MDRVRDVFPAMVPLDALGGKETCHYYLCATSLSPLLHGPRKNGYKELERLAMKGEGGGGRVPHDVYPPLLSLGMAHDSHQIPFDGLIHLVFPVIMHLPHSPHPTISSLLSIRRWGGWVEKGLFPLWSKKRNIPLFFTQGRRNYHCSIYSILGNEAQRSWIISRSTPC